MRLPALILFAAIANFAQPALAAAEADKNPVPPSAVVVDPRTKSEAQRGMPRYEQDGRTVVINALAVTADSDTLDTIKAKIATEGWPSVKVTPPGQSMILAIYPAGKEAQQVLNLLDRFRKGEFGSVKAELISEPDSSQQ